MYVKMWQVKHLFKTNVWVCTHTGILFAQAKMQTLSKTKQPMKTRIHVWDVWNMCTYVYCCTYVCIHKYKYTGIKHAYDRQQKKNVHTYTDAHTNIRVAQRSTASYSTSQYIHTYILLPSSNLSIVFHITIHTYIYTCIHTCTQQYPQHHIPNRHTYIHTYIHTYTYAYIPVPSSIHSIIFQIKSIFYSFYNYVRVCKDAIQAFLYTGEILEDDTMSVMNMCSCVLLHVHMPLRDEYSISMQCMWHVHMFVWLDVNTCIQNWFWKGCVQCVCLSMCLCVCVCGCIYIYTHIYCMYMCVCVCVCMYTMTHSLTHTYVHIHKEIQVDTYMNA